MARIALDNTRTQKEYWRTPHNRHSGVSARNHSKRWRWWRRQSRRWLGALRETVEGRE